MTGMKLLIPALAAGAFFFAPSGRPGTDSAARRPRAEAAPAADAEGHILAGPEIGAGDFTHRTDGPSAAQRPRRRTGGEIPSPRLSPSPAVPPGEPTGEPTGEIPESNLATADASPPASTPPPAEPAPPAAQYGRVPPHFIRNDGQLAEEVAYYLKGPRGTVYLTADEVVFDFLSGQIEPADQPSPPEAEEETTVSRLVFRLRFSDPDPGAALEGAEELPGKINYFIGDRENWRTSIPTYREVVYRGLYPGIDLVCRLEGANIRYRWTVSPGADPGRIKFSYSGVDGLEINPDGDLIVLTPFGGFRTPAPRLRQEIAGQPAEIAGAFVIRDDLTVALKIAPYDRESPLVIDF
jgi:hypothetical protein